VNPIDLRSDTVTRPTAAMRSAMADAEVGDDVWGDDPTVQRLEHLIAERCGFEAALFFPSGTQSNLAAMLTHCGRGDEVLLGDHSHTFLHEGGGAAALGSIPSHPLPNQPDGSIRPDDIGAAIKPDDPHFARTRLLCLENTIDGKVVPQHLVEAACATARRRGLATPAKECGSPLKTRGALPPGRPVEPQPWPSARVSTRRTKSASDRSAARRRSTSSSNCGQLAKSLPGECHLGSDVQTG
jgi:hypothetical protein